MTKKSPCILLIDDDSDTNMVTMYLINKEKLAGTIATALNGEEAITYLKNNPLPDLIFLDINMPRLNGWEFLEEYDKMDVPMKESVKIVVTTASSNPEDQQRAKQQSLDFIGKPLTTEMLKKIISVL